MNVRVIFIVFIIFLIFFVGGIVLQIYLSRRQNKWLGLILPIISLLFSMLIVLGNTVFITNLSTEHSTVENVKDGEVINTFIKNTIDVRDIQPSEIITVLILFLLYNIPTAVLLVIYYACRENLKRKKELEKMNILDLE